MVSPPRCCLCQATLEAAPGSPRRTPCRSTSRLSTEQHPRSGTAPAWHSTQEVLPDCTAVLTPEDPAKTQHAPQERSYEDKGIEANANIVQQHGLATRKYKRELTVTTCSAASARLCSSSAAAMCLSSERSLASATIFFHNLLCTYGATSMLTIANEVCT
eukprot:CAMPEP_0171107770 /NCGR_PEP_ID=MMETSP0766_2-20121228/67529_1 /TAXON_ID=439317 /ORGANISM="Gambierdiscus australes, Strain CAWD 149" /LENGTH=159 /DNA_ID=CAMNT_0011569161 /DNA_START=18 /DNA_END=499 /DNA_ORIENTATION=+